MADRTPEDEAELADALAHDPRHNHLLPVTFLTLYASELATEVRSGLGHEWVSFKQGTTFCAIHGSRLERMRVLEEWVRAEGYDPAALYHHALTEALVERAAGEQE